MEVRLPKFKHHRDGNLLLDCSREAKEINQNSKDKTSVMSKPLEEVRKQAIEAVKKRKGDVNNDLDVQGEYLIQFGRYQGQSFRWMLENALGYVGWFVDNICSELVNPSAISQNKAALKKYVESFEEGRQVVALKKKKREDKEAKNRASSIASQNSAPKPVVSPLAAGLASGHVSTHLSRVSTASVTAAKFKPSIPPQTRFRKSVVKPSATCTMTTSTSTQSTCASTDDKGLLAITEEMEKTLAKPQLLPEPAMTPQVEPVLEDPQYPEPERIPTVSMAPSVSNINPDHPPLPEGWRKTLPKSDHLWVSQALFSTNVKGKATLDWGRVDKLWWYPPQPPLITSQLPHPDLYFSQPLLLWMPRKLWKVTLHCPHPECDKKPLTSAGIYNTVRQVVDIDRNYNLAGEYLECKNCKRKVISWSSGIVKQLDMGHRLQFPVLLTYQYACDVRVIRLLGQRGLGNSSTQLQKKLTEQHSEKYLQRSVQYLTECQNFARASRSGLTDPIHFQEPPEFVPVVIRETTFQLPEFNQASQWFIKRDKMREKETLKQGLRPAAVPLPPALPQVSFPFPFTFDLPDNTTGKATLRKPVAIQPRPVIRIQVLPVPLQPRAVQRVSRPVAAPQPPPTPVAVQPKPVPPKGPVRVQPKQTEQIPVAVLAPAPKPTKKRTKKQSDDSSSRSSYARICKHCGKARDPTTHRHYYGNWYCQNMTEDYETWKESHKSSKKIKKKKTE